MLKKITLMVKKHLLRMSLGVCLVLLFAGHSAKQYEMPFLTVLDSYLYDSRLRFTLPGGVDERIVIVDIDEKSLASIGRWPWGRNTLAQLVDNLFDEYGITLLGFDVIFAEPDFSSGLLTLETMAKGELRNNPIFQERMVQLRSALNYDDLFSRALQNRPVILAYSFSNHAYEHKTGRLPDPVLTGEVFLNRNISFLSWRGYSANLAVLHNAARSAGHINPLIDFDGVSRRVPLLVEYGGNYYETLSLTMARTLLNSPRVIPVFSTSSNQEVDGYGGLEWVAIPYQDGEIFVPVDKNAAALIPYRGPQGSFRYISAMDVVNKSLPRNFLQGKIVIVGTSAPGLLDLRATPVAKTYPGVEIHASMLAGILDENIKGRPEFMIGAEVLVVVLAGFLLAIALPLTKPLAGTGILLLLLSLLTFVTNYAWNEGIDFPLASILILCAALYALNMSWGYIFESRINRKMQSLFGQYVPPSLVDIMAQDPDKYNMTGRNATLTILFTDVRGFSTISESMHPGQLAEMMNDLNDAMTEIIRRHNGTLDKYIGDAIMAFWGAPVEDRQHARNAILSALEMQAVLVDVNRSFVARGWTALRIGIGINSGLVTVGDMGSKVRRSYTVIGNSVNLASRIEGLNKYYQAGVIVGEDTYSHAPEFAYRFLDTVRVKGIEKPVAIYEPLGEASALPGAVQEELRIWQQAIEHYRHREWVACKQLVNPLADKNPHCAIYARYLDRLNQFIADPPDDAWSPVVRHDT